MAKRRIDRYRWLRADTLWAINHCRRSPLVETRAALRFWQRQLVKIRVTYKRAIQRSAASAYTSHMNEDGKVYWVGKPRILPPS